MTAKQIFEQFPKAEKCWQAGNSEFFLDEEEANAYATHFNVSTQVVHRSQVMPDEKKGTEAKKASEPKKPAKPKDTKPKEPEEEESEEEEEGDKGEGNDEDSNKE